MKHHSSHTNRHLIRLICILCGLLLYGCAAPGNSPMRTLKVESPGAVIATVYLDSTYVGTTPLTMSVNQDSIDGSQLLVIHQGEVLLNRRLKKDPQEVVESQKTAMGIGLVASGALMLAMPFPWAFIAPITALSTSSVIAYSVTPDSLKNNWTYFPLNPTNKQVLTAKPSATKSKVETKSTIKTITKSDSSTKFRETNLTSGGMHHIQKTLFWLDKNFDKKTIHLKASIYPIAGNDLVLSSGICYDKSNRTIWLQSDLHPEITYPINLNELINKCISLDSTQKVKKKSIWKPVLITTGIGAGLGALLGGDEPSVAAAALGALGFLYSAMFSLIYCDSYTVDGEEDGICPLAPPEKEELEKWLSQYPCDSDSQ